MTKSNESHIWDMWPNENRDQYGAFILFRDSAYPSGVAGEWVRRTIPNTIRIAHEKGWTLAQTTANTWHHQYGWADRARAYDLWLDQITKGSIESELIRMRRKQLRALAKISELVEGETDRHLARIDRLNRDQEGNPVDMPVTVTKPKELAQMLRHTVTMERLVMGETTEQIGGLPGTTEVMDLTNCTLEDLREIERVRAKYKAP